VIEGYVCSSCEAVRRRITESCPLTNGGYDGRHLAQMDLVRLVLDANRGFQTGGLVGPQGPCPQPDRGTQSLSAVDGQEVPLAGPSAGSPQEGPDQEARPGEPALTRVAACAQAAARDLFLQALAHLIDTRDDWVEYAVAAPARFPTRALAALIEEQLARLHRAHWPQREVAPHRVEFVGDRPIIVIKTAERAERVAT